MDRPSNRWIAVGITALVALGAGVTALVGTGHKKDDRMPPPLASHAADVQRLTIVSHGNPSSPTGGIKLADGTSVGLAVQNTGKVPTTDRAVLVVQKNSTAVTPKIHIVKAGDTVTEFGVRVKVLKIWQMPNPDHDAMDVQVDAATG